MSISLLACVSVCQFVCWSVFLLVCLSGCLLACVSVCQFVWWPVCLFVSLSVGLCVYLSICLLVFLSLCQFVCWSVCFFVSLSVGLCVCMSFFLLVCLSVCQFSKLVTLVSLIWWKVCSLIASHSLDYLTSGPSCISSYVFIICVFVCPISSPKYCFSCLRGLADKRIYFTLFLSNCCDKPQNFLYFVY